MLSDKQIEGAKRVTRYTFEASHHEHPDCIRMAYQWLDAQKKTKGVVRTTLALKHMIEKWAGRYVSTSDVEVAAALHPDIKGTYPHFNISSRLTEPSEDRLHGLSEAYKHHYNKHHDPSAYAKHE